MKVRPSRASVRQLLKRLLVASLITLSPKVGAEPWLSSNPSQIMAKSKKIGTVTCQLESPISEERNTRPMTKATLETKGDGYILKFTEILENRQSETVWDLDSKLLIDEAESDGGSWNLTSYDRRSPVSIKPTGQFEIKMMVSSRSFCTFSGTLQFIGKSKAQLFLNSSSFSKAPKLTASSNCKDAVKKAERMLENAKTRVITEKQKHYYKNPPSNRHFSYSFALMGAGSKNVLNSPVFLNNITTNIISNCKDIGMVGFGIYATDTIYSFGLMNDGKVREFRCKRPFSSEPPWGYVPCF